ncbi:MAG TPA: metallophosphoesterase family protein [Bacteroidales bacterium]|nr:metallophosphoesterase family protein [Bacteroidales bacterium]
MTRIGLLSDTHGYIHPKLYDFFNECNELWHAGDMGNIGVADELNAFKPLRAVYGNVDGYDVRKVYREELVFWCEKVKVAMMHIGGYPGKYSPAARTLISLEKPKIFISGHSHILKVINDPHNHLLHINPGAAGKEGMHQVSTAIRFAIDGERIFDLEILELKR